MRYSAEHKAETHQRIVRKAAAQFREHGISGVGVAEVMKQAGLTHGGFYAHFDSKDALFEEALESAFEDTRRNMIPAVEAAPPKQRARAFAEVYMTPVHRDRPDRGCAIAALGAEIARCPPKLRGRFEQGVERLIQLIQGEDTSPAARQKAITQLSAMVGALMLSRAVKSKAFSDELLESVKASI